MIVLSPSLSVEVDYITIHVFVHHPAHRGSVLLSRLAVPLYRKETMVVALSCRHI
jgi:hypothetical protein